MTAYTYDSTGHLESIEQADGSDTDFVSPHLNALENGIFTETVTDDRGVTTEYTYDRLGNLTREADDLGNETIYVRDENGLLLTTIYPDPDGEGTMEMSLFSTLSGGELESPVYEYTYDSRGNRLTETLPDESVRTWECHATWNQPTKYTDANGHITLYTYDTSHELLLTESNVIGECSMTRSTWKRMT